MTKNVSQFPCSRDELLWRRPYCSIHVQSSAEHCFHKTRESIALAGQEKDGIKGLRAMDMFTNGWVDTSKNRLNHADEQMRLLSLH